MKWYRKLFGILIKITVCLLILWSIGFACIWYFYVYPTVRREDPKWRGNVMLTDNIRWKLREGDIARYGWLHNDGIDVGRHGDKQWVARIMDYLAEGGKLDGCPCGHKESALPLLTCQEPEEGTEAQWLKWWEKNREKSQVDWIRDGLAKYGVEVETPATEKDFVPLLKLLGTPKPDDPETPDPVPDYVRYNAYRWLRDSDFDPIAFAMKCDTNLTPDIVRKGLTGYYIMASGQERLYVAGILPLREDYQDVDLEEFNENVPLIFTNEGQIIIYGLMVGPLVLGVGLLWLIGKKKKHAPAANAAPHPPEIT